MEKTLATRYSEAVDQIDAHRQTIAALNEKIVGLESVLADNELLQAKVAELESNAVAVAEANESLIAEKAARIDELSAQIESLQGKLALSPAYIDVAGTCAVNDVAGADQPADWPEAMAKCNGDYVAARRSFPELFSKFINQTK